MPDHTERNAGIVAMYADGLSCESIGKQIGLTAERVRQILKAAGVQMRSKGHRSAKPAQEGHDHQSADAAGQKDVPANVPEPRDGLAG